MYEIVEKLKEISVARLHKMLNDVLTRAEKGVVDEIGGFLALSQSRDQILTAFTQNMDAYFDELMDKPVNKPEPVYNFETLSLVGDADLEIMVALEGMVNAARNGMLPVFISFNTRLNSLFPNKRIDESTNPLDPSQIGEAFKEAIRPLGLDAQNSLSVYRQFNTQILKNLDKVLADANALLAENGIIPNMGMDGVGKPRPRARLTPRPHDTNQAFGTVEEDPYVPADNNPELFSMMQNLLHPSAKPPGGGAPAGAGGVPGDTPGAATPAGTTQQYAIPSSLLATHQGQSGVMQPFVPQQGEQVQMVDQAKLMEILTNIQKSLADRPATATGEIPSDLEDVDRIDISGALGEMLKEGQSEGVVNAVDGQSSDIINLVTLLYEAIWDDESVPIPIKELIGRTQITIIKVALSDTTFFNKENHPARMVLNEFAAAGIGWTEVDELEEDPLYKKIQDLVHKILTEYKGDVSFFEDIVNEFRAFRAREAAKAHVLEQRILRAKERQERLDDINELVNQKIAERVLGRELQDFVREMLDGPFHKFMVMLVLKEGPGTNAWKQAINTIDVLLWTVQPHEQAGDRKRLGTVNPRLLNNLRKAFRIAQMEASAIDELIEGLKAVQESTFGESAPAPVQPEEDGLDLEKAQAAASRPKTAAEPVEPMATGEEPDDEAGTLDEDDRHVKQVDSLHVGIWVEFAGEENISIRCKLAARISAIDKYIFVNRQGVKVVEKTRMGLAQELKDGTVKIISDGLLFSRALETVIGNLRVSQHEQQTGSAYQPGAAQQA
ncbi:MAG TPA: DUF1631 domain-containing protein [Pseudomonadales bacterium]|nr:DUF1631 domain-containing protein [Pseudomonadales bacterium]